MWQECSTHNSERAVIHYVQLDNCESKQQLLEHMTEWHFSFRYFICPWWSLENSWLFEIWKLTVEMLQKFSEPSPCFYSQPQFCNWKWPIGWPQNQLHGTGSSLTVSHLVMKSWCSEELTVELCPKVVQISSHFYILLLCDYPLSMPKTKLATCFCWFIAWLTLQPWRWR